MDQRSVEVSIEAKQRKLDRNGNCREAVKLEEKEFFKGKKKKEINATSKQLNQKST